MADTGPSPMQGVIPPPLAQPTPVAPIGTSETQPPQPLQQQDEHACETLYIQNLNEKIKPDGAQTHFTRSNMCLIQLTCIADA